MKGFTRYLISSIILLAGISCNAAVTISVIPNTNLAAIGDIITADVAISGLPGDGNGPSLGAYDLDFTFNPAVLGDLTIAFGDPNIGDQLALTTPAFTCIGVFCGAASNFPVEIAEVSLDPDTTLNALQPPSFTLATFTFHALAAGGSRLLVSNLTLGDQDGNLLSFDSILNSGVQVVSVATPEPNTSSALALGLAGIACLAARRRALRARV